MVAGLAALDQNHSWLGMPSRARDKLTLPVVLQDVRQWLPMVVEDCQPWMPPESAPCLKQAAVPDSNLVVAQVCEAA